jgi:hypothetical protein
MQLKDATVGVRVITTEGCGDSNREGKVIDWNRIVFIEGVPFLKGEDISYNRKEPQVRYMDIDKRKSIPILDNKNRIFIMYPQYLRRV